MIEIGCADGRDMPDIQRLESACFSEPWSLGSLQAHLSSPRSLTLIARLSGELVGYAFGTVIAPEGELYRIAVSPSLRKRGVGEKLLAVFLEKCREMGAFTVYLEVRENNTAARMLYQNAGFALVGIRKNYAAVLSKNL